MNKKAKNTILIDIAVPNTHNLAKTITDKQNKYQELANEICNNNNNNNNIYLLQMGCYPMAVVILHVNRT